MVECSKPKFLCQTSCADAALKPVTLPNTSYTAWAAHFGRMKLLALISTGKQEPTLADPYPLCLIAFQFNLDAELFSRD